MRAPRTRRGLLGAGAALVALLGATPVTAGKRHPGNSKPGNGQNGSPGRIGVHEQTVRGWIKAGELKAHTFGSRIGYRIRLGDYEEFLNRRTLTGTIAAHLLQGAATAPES